MQGQVLERPTAKKSVMRILLLQVTLINAGELPLTSADISYNIDAESSTSVSWTGNLLSGESVVVATPTYANLASGSHSFTINVSNPNGIADENTANDVYVFNFEVSPAYVTSNVILNLLTDNYPSETTWNLLDSSGAVVASGPSSPYSEASNSQETIPIPNVNECYTFVIYDSYGDGICCGFFTGNGSYSLEDDSGNVIKTGGEFSDEDAVTFKVQESLGVNDFGLNAQIKIYPNPITDIINVDLTSINEKVDYEIYTTLGQRLVSGNLVPHKTHSLNMSAYQSGIYFVKLSTGSQTITQKVIKN